VDWRLTVELGGKTALRFFVRRSAWLGYFLSTCLGDVTGFPVEFIHFFLKVKFFV
jgi:hypothetical protein